jgi:type IV secretory pathway ATPase VirB11/archaellum biosynthesis ATPase
MKLDFLNGTIIVPDEYGGYVVASGCGTGKTTAIKQIIKEISAKSVVAEKTMDESVEIINEQNM